MKVIKFDDFVLWISEIFIKITLFNKNVNGVEVMLAVFHISLYALPSFINWFISCHFTTLNSATFLIRLSSYTSTF